jgi:hypothetical protein
MRNRTFILASVLAFVLGLGAVCVVAQSGRFSWIVVGGREAVTITGLYGTGSSGVAWDATGVPTITCQEDAPTFAVAGAAVGDVVMVSPRGVFSVNTGLATCRVSAADVVTCALCNSTLANPANPDSITLDVLVIRFAAHR